MNDVVKLDLRIPRKNVLLLAKVIEKGLQTKPGESLEGLLRAAGEGSQEALQQGSTPDCAKSDWVYRTPTAQVETAVPG